jgi:hypothetical protein
VASSPAAQVNAPSAALQQSSSPNAAHTGSGWCVVARTRAQLACGALAAHAHRISRVGVMTHARAHLRVAASHAYRTRELALPANMCQLRDSAIG